MNVSGFSSAPFLLMRVLHVGPLPPTASGIADYAAALIPELSKRVDLSVAISDDGPLPSNLPSGIEVHRSSELSIATRRQFDAVLYQVGNHRYHAWMLRLLQTWPGFVVLHDGTLHHLFADVLLARGRVCAYVREVAALEGLAAARHAEYASTGATVPRWFDDRMIGSAVHSAHGVIAHSESIRTASLAADPSARVRIVHLGVDAPPDAQTLSIIRRRGRMAFGIADDAIVVGTFGGLTREKQIEAIIDACAELQRRSMPIILLLGGEEQHERAISDQILASGIGSTVIRTGRLPLDRLEDAIAACDICVQVRTPTSGEASAIVLRALRLGRPTIVSDDGWFASLPDVAVRHIHVTSDAGQISEALVCAIECLIAVPEERTRIGEKAQERARAWSWSRAAESYVTFFQEVINAREKTA